MSGRSSAQYQRLVQTMVRLPCSRRIGSMARLGLVGLRDHSVIMQRDSSQQLGQLTGRKVMHVALVQSWSTGAM